MDVSSQHLPLVSVGVPVFNEEKYIYDLLLSIYRQTYSNLEVIISDNASSDRTWAIIDDFVEQDDRFRATQQPNNRGAAENFGYVLEKAQGEFFIWAGGHDLWEADMIRSMVKMFEVYPTLVLCAPQTKLIDKEGHFIVEHKAEIDTSSATTPANRVLLFLKQMRRGNAIYGLHRREILLRTWPWPNSSDLIGLMRIAALGDIITDNNVYWHRRQVRSETVPERTERHIEILRYSGLLAKFPFFIGTLSIIWELFKFRGATFERVRLIAFFLQKFIFNRAYLRNLALDTIIGFTKRGKAKPV